MIKVYHNPNYMEIATGQYHPTSIPTEIILVAEVATNNLEEAYLFTQHREKTSWTVHPRVNTIKESRSTRVGDFLEDDRSNVYVIEKNKFRIVSKVKMWKQVI